MILEVADQSIPVHQAHPDLTVRLILDQPPFAGQVYVAAFRICLNPCCPCTTVGFECRGKSNPDEVLRFDLDLMTRKLATEQTTESAGAALGRALLDEAEESHWVWLCDLLLSTKRRQMETMDLDTLDVQFAPDVLAGEGTMVAYLEIFPWAGKLAFNLDGSEWFVDDQHCVRPGCDCTETCLLFYRAPAPDRQSTGPIRPAVDLFFDRCSGKTTVSEKQPGSPNPALLMGALRSAVPNLNDILRHHHEHLKRLGKRFLPEAEGLRSGRGQMDSAAEQSRLNPFPTDTLRISPRIGRNEPCPCGSGRKFKKCCGA